MKDEFFLVVRDFAFLCAGILIALMIQDAFAVKQTQVEKDALKAQLRAHRHAVEIMYESCVQTCSNDCRKESK